MPAAATTFTTGSIVRVRGRDWVVTAASGDILHLKPLTGSENGATVVHTGLEGPGGIAPSEFPLPSPSESGDLLAGQLLRDAARLALRDGAAPFRGLGRISVRPRPYQFVPLIMALRQSPARLLIADDVGIGKTIEAGVIASELLIRGEARRLLVLCPPHLCDQWQQELSLKFHIQAEVVRGGTVARLERATPAGQSLYEYFPHLILSIDFAKTDHNRPALLQHCPDLVIVDEAHAAAAPGASERQQQRFDLVRTIASDAARHLLLLSATPHSGIEISFQSLLALLDPTLGQYELDSLSETQRRNLARYVVQRRRGDIDARWLGGTGERRPFPERVPPFEETYRMGPEYLGLFQDVLAFTRRAVTAGGLDEPRRRARYWAALALLRCLMSSPAAAERALERRAGRTGEIQVSDEEHEREVLDDPMVAEFGLDLQPDVNQQWEDGSLSPHDRAVLRVFQKRAANIAAGGHDSKIARTAEILHAWLQAGHRSIVFCRFVATATYVADQLKKLLRDRYPDLRVAAVSGETGSEEEREAAIAALVEPELGGGEPRILVATDCLSEGINLQQHFDAVLHYDLPWNPNRLEQREGRVDRFGQTRAQVRAVVLYSEDNPIDGVILNVLIRKAREIYKALGISVPVPAESESVLKAVLRAVFETGPGGDPRQLQFNLPGLESVQAFQQNWQRNADREQRRRTRFAQHAISPEEVAAELDRTDSVLGDPGAVRNFLLNASQRMQLGVKARADHCLLDPAALPPELRERLPGKGPTKVVFAAPPPSQLEDAVVLGRNHPFIAALSDRVLARAFAPRSLTDRARSGAIFTHSVPQRTLLALLRVRYRLLRRAQPEQFAEEVLTAVGSRPGGTLDWRLDNDDLLHGAEAAANISSQEKELRLREAVAEAEAGSPALVTLAAARARDLEQCYARLRGVIGGAAVGVEVLPPDLLGVYVLLPAGGGET